MVELDDESIRSIILAIDPAIDVLSLLLFDEFFILSAFASDSALAIALCTLFNIGGSQQRARALAARKASGAANWPEENYYGWLINDRLEELQAVL